MERSPLPFELIKANEHHGPYIVNAYGADVCDFYAMSNPSALSVRNGGDSKPVPFVDADGNAEFMWRAANSFDAMLEALNTTRALVAEAAMTGFNCHDGDWAERLFRNQGSLTAAIALATQVQS
jgi:hypothetical protein